MAALLAVGAGVLAASGCAAPSRTLTVFAAASLREPLERLARSYEAAYPGVDVQVQFDGSSRLAAQIAEGAPADVFAAADDTTMARALDAAGEPAGAAQVFASNRLAIAVPPGNPAGITGPADLGVEAHDIGLCAESVPCGRYAREAMARAGVTPRPDTEEPDVRSLLVKVASGDLDAGMVYVTDIRGTGGRGVEEVAVPDEVNVTARYPIASLDEGADSRAFVELVLGAEGRDTLGRAGFGAP